MRVDDTGESCNESIGPKLPCGPENSDDPIELLRDEKKFFVACPARIFCSQV